MGPYCRFCGQRCFLERVLPDGPDAGRTLLMATCARGMEHDRAATGHNHTSAINPVLPRDLDDEQLASLRQTAQEVRDLGLPGRWRWDGNTKAGWAYLSTAGSGGQIILTPQVRHEHVTYTSNYDDVEKRVVDGACTTGGCPFHGILHGSEDSPAEDRTHMQETPTFGFRIKPDGGPARIAVAHEIARFEVCPEATSEDDQRVYRHDLDGFRSPVADYLAAFDADTMLALLDELRMHRARAHRLTLAAVTG